MENFLNKHLHKIAIMIPFVIAGIMLIAIFVFAKAMELKMYDTKNVEIVEVRLPSVELEKYKKLDKIKQ